MPLSRKLSDKALPGVAVRPVPVDHKVTVPAKISELLGRQPVASVEIGIGNRD